MNDVDTRYRDASLPVEDRVEILLAQMTLEEKAGLFFHTMIVPSEDGELAGPDQTFGTKSNEEYISGLLMNHFNLLGGMPSAKLGAVWHNKLQEAAAKTRLGIPVTISTDPRHAFSDNPLAALASGAFSQWPDTLGLAALQRRDPGRALRRHRPPGVHRRGHPRGPAPADRPRHRAALGPPAEHVRRGPRPHLAPRGRVHPRVPGRRTRRGFGRGHGQALPRRRPAAGRRGPALRRTDASRSTRAVSSSCTSSRSRRPSRPASRRSCRTTGCRSAPSTRRSASASTSP